MTKQLILPRSALEEVEALLRLDEDQLAILDEMIAQRLGLANANPHVVTLVCRFLAEVASMDDGELATALDSKRPPSPATPCESYLACEEDRPVPLEMGYEEPLTWLEPDADMVESREW